MSERIEPGETKLSGWMIGQYVSGWMGTRGCVHNYRECKRSPSTNLISLTTEVEPEMFSRCLLLSIMDGET